MSLTSPGSGGVYELGVSHLAVLDKPYTYAVSDLRGLCIGPDCGDQVRHSGEIHCSWHDDLAREHAGGAPVPGESDMTGDCPGY